MKLLESLGRANLNSPEKLKYLLSPIIVQRSAEQERFYEIFDHYWEELQQPWPMPVETQAKKKEVPDWVRWLLVAAVLGGLAWASAKYIQQSNLPAPIIFFQHQENVAIGDTLHFDNLSENIDSTALRWEIVDTMTGQTELVDTQSFDLDFVPAKAGENQNREVRLKYLKPLEGSDQTPTVHASSFHIRCKNPPVIDAILTVREVNPNTKAAFEAKITDASAVELIWDFGDSSTAKGAKVTHKYANAGEYQVKLIATRLGLDGDCSIVKTSTISVGQDKAYLDAKAMVLDQVEASVNFYWGTWVLMGLFGLAMIWFWVKWVARKPPPMPDAAGIDLSAISEKYKAADKGPYFIPFRPQDGFVRMEPQFFRLADVFRQRQEGLRRNMDVPASVKKTIQEGGFPNLLRKADAVPTEYLFLIDEQSPSSHLSKLYSFLVDFLRKREVLGEVFYFKTEPIRFWNNQFPEGITPDQLHRLFPFHRLIVMGDGHGLFDPHQVGKSSLPALRPDASAFFGMWKQRLLLTPIPVVSWTYREGALHGYFAIFPSDTEGLGEAVNYVERGMSSEDLPTYSLWCEQLLEGRRETDLNYRRWRTAPDHRDFLKDYPELYRWVCALAVYPKPDWNITLAIGRALAPFGIELNYDNILRIARIPWLQTGDISPKLRKELLNDIDPEAERLAREAVKIELEAVVALVQGSHANQEHKINLALQNFAVAPDNPVSQTAIRELLALGLITPRQLNDLNQNVERFTAQKEQATWKSNPISQTLQSTSADNATLAPDIHAFLDENKPKPVTPEKPFLTKDFWRASVATILYLLIFIFAWHYGGTKELSNWTKPLFSQNEDCQVEYAMVYALIKECNADSNILYNNEGVRSFNNFLASQEDSIPDLEYGNTVTWLEAEANFKKALKIKPDYELAKRNLGSLYFNSGKLVYDSKLQALDFTNVGPYSPSIVWDAALPQFQRSLAFDSVKIDALHALGLIHFYAERKDSAESFYNAILEATDSLYFDTLRAYPNLQSLLYKNGKVVLEEVAITVLDEKSGNPLSDVLVVSDSISKITDMTGNATLEQPRGQLSTYLLTKKGYYSLRFRPKVKSLAYTVSMKKQIIVEKVIDSDRDGVPDVNDKCPKEPGDPKNAGCPNITPIQTFKEPVMIFVKGGSFQMGCNEKRDSACEPDELPIHQVRLRDFEIGKYEVTNEEFAEFLNDYGANPTSVNNKEGSSLIKEHPFGIQFPKQIVSQKELDDSSSSKFAPRKGYEKYPVINVSWYGAVAYIQWLSERTGKNYRLPTEAEWEYAAQGGNNSPGFRYSGSDKIGEVAWYSRNSSGRTHAVGGKAPNQLGIFDMTGNADEWCSDWYDARYYQNFVKAEAYNPVGPSSGELKVMRGNQFNDYYSDIQVVDRIAVKPDYIGNETGFRVVLEVRYESGK